MNTESHALIMRNVIMNIQNPILSWAYHQNTTSLIKKIVFISKDTIVQITPACLQVMHVRTNMYWQHNHDLSHIPVLIEASSPIACKTLTTSSAIKYNQQMDVMNAAIMRITCITLLGGFLGFKRNISGTHSGATVCKRYVTGPRKTTLMEQTN